MTKKTVKNEQDVSIELAKAVIHGIEEKKGKNIKALDLRQIPNSVCDFFIICEGDSSTQVSAIADSVADEVKKITNKRPHHIEGMQNAEWVLVDYIDVVVHVFQPEIRHFYKLESLWADAKPFYTGQSDKEEYLFVDKNEKHKRKEKVTVVSKSTTVKPKADVTNQEPATKKPKVVAKNKVVKKAKAKVKTSAKNKVKAKAKTKVKAKVKVKSASKPKVKVVAKTKTIKKAKKTIVKKKKAAVKSNKKKK